jgi:alkylation response protein AidB-like acyl-CoA dehydrogenase
MWQKMGEAGLLGITVEEDYGGLAMGYQAHCIVMEELSRASGTNVVGFPRGVLLIGYRLHSTFICSSFPIMYKPDTTTWNSRAS